MRYERKQFILWGYVLHIRLYYTTSGYYKMSSNDSSWSSFLSTFFFGVFVHLVAMLFYPVITTMLKALRDSFLEALGIPRDHEIEKDLIMRAIEIGRFSPDELLDIALIIRRIGAIEDEPRRQAVLRTLLLHPDLHRLENN
ncbi:uncharacterized protein LOC135847147 [Planococcus citri]|uniref:uncharacterized protein LOC135847147 n=1 Tax=Planococcus citri TaxID=170843 RepID=UPI0031F9EF91